MPAIYLPPNYIHNNNNTVIVSRLQSGNSHTRMLDCRDNITAKHQLNIPPYTSLLYAVIVTYTAIDVTQLKSTLLKSTLLKSTLQNCEKLKTKMLK